MTRGPT